MNSIPAYIFWSFLTNIGSRSGALKFGIKIVWWPSIPTACHQRILETCSQYPQLMPGYSLNFSVNWQKLKWKNSPYSVELAMRSYLMANISTYTMVASLISSLSSSHKAFNCLLNSLAPSFLDWRHPYWSMSLAFLLVVASCWGKQPKGPVLCTQNFFPPCWYMLLGVWFKRNQKEK